MRALIASCLLLAGCQANPPVPVESLRMDERIVQAWRVESGSGVLPAGAVLRFDTAKAPEAHGKLNPPLARANITGAEPPGTRTVYHVTASAGVVPAEFDAYPVELGGRTLLCLPLLNAQRERVGPAGFVGEAFTLQQLALMESGDGTLTLRLPRKVLAWMPWPNFPTNAHEAEEGLYRPTARREGVTNSFTHLLELYKAHMDEGDFWGEAVVLRSEQQTVNSEHQGR